MNHAHRDGGPPWDSIRVFLVPDGVLCMRTTARKWNVAGLCGPNAELCFFLTKEDVKHGPLLPSERPSMRYDHRQLFGFDPEVPLSCFCSKCKFTLFDSSREWTLARGGKSHVVSGLSVLLCYTCPARSGRRQLSNERATFGLLTN